MPHKPLHVTATDMFCGAGGSSLGAEACGVDVRLGLNHWKLAIETHQTNFPNTAHDCTDISACDPRRYPSTDILITSPECFPAGTLILCERGFVPIEEVGFADHVFTHKGRWRRVTALGSREAGTITIRGNGHPGLEVTAEHPFYARTTGFRNRRTRIMGVPEWVEACALAPGVLWASPIMGSGNALPIPPVGGRGAEFTPAFWWMVGKWLADGVVTTKTDGITQHIRISCSLAEVEDTFARINAAAPSQFHAGPGEFSWSREQRERQVILTTSHNGLGVWLTTHFGKLAHGKRLPTWALTMPAEWRGALLDGYIYGDGVDYPDRNERKFSTVSKALAIGVRLLVLSLGHACSLISGYGGDTGAIDGISYTRKTLYTGGYITAPVLETSVVDGDLRWSPVRTISDGKQGVTVYNLSIEEDESYIADGIVVHNCTAHTLAKGRRRKGIEQKDLWEKDRIDPSEERSRSTMWDVPRFAEYHTYNIVITENVVDAALYWPLFEVWLTAMTTLGYAYEIVCFNSMFAHPTPQSRDRLYVVFWRKGNTRPQLAITPVAWCLTCQGNVHGVQAWKRSAVSRGGFKVGKYGHHGQYVYRCPTCQHAVTPYYYCAANAIDWSLQGERIGDRKVPLRPRTMERIAYGLKKFGGQAVALRYDGSKLRALTDPLPTQTTRQEKALVTPPPFLMGMHGEYYTFRGVDQEIPTCVGSASTTAFITSTNYFSDRPRGLDETLPTQTTKQPLGLTTAPPGAFLATLRNHATASGVESPLGTVTAGGGHHGLVVPPLVLGQQGGAVARPITEELPTVATGGAIGLIDPPPFLLDYYGGRHATHPVTEPGTTVSTYDNHALVVPAGGTWSEAVTNARTQPHPTQATREANGVVFPPHMLVPYYGRSDARATEEPARAVTTHDREALVSVEVAVEDCRFRMLQPAEIQSAMAFPPSYKVLGNQREKVKQLGNAVTPPVLRLLLERCIATLAG